MVGLAGVGFSPIDAVVPFTYRDNATYLQILENLKDKVEEIRIAINAESSNNAGGLNALREELFAALDVMRTELEAMIEALQGEVTVLDPTTGNRIESLSVALSHVYDNNRIYAYFARQYDELNLTAAEYDALQYSARQFDLVVTYPTLNAIQE